MPKILLFIMSYPRKDNRTPKVFRRMVKTLFQNIPDNLKLEILVVGDDYPNIKRDFKQILDSIKIKYTLVNINRNNALRNMKASRILKWQHCCTRSLIYAFKNCVRKDYDYMIKFDDDDYYSPNYFTLLEDTIVKYGNQDLIFGLGEYLNKCILPKIYDKILTKNSPTPCDTVSSGIVFKVGDRFFLDITQFLEKRWMLVSKNLHKPDLVNDELMWTYLKPKFNDGTYTSVLIPEIIVYHDTEQTIFDNI
jgi:hypothetical protein